MDGYNEDEALRIVNVSAMIEGDTYVFRVNNTGGRFMVMLERHELPRGFFQKDIPCCKNTTDPCAVHSKDLKDAIRRSIEMHKKHVHHLTLLS
jgi:hypothetical protein